MSKTVKQITIFISSPSDVKTEREQTLKVIDELNRTLCNPNGLILSSLTWENDTYPSVGSYSQEAINEQTTDYDIFVGIMANRFGTQTPKAGSGTEEEFNLAYDKKEQVHIMFFFKNAQINTNDIDIEQLQKIRDFKKEISDKGVYYREFSENYEQLFRECLTKYISDHYLNHKKSEIQLGEKTISLNKEFEEYLHSTDTYFTHPSGEEITLEDLFVPQNLRTISEDRNKEKRTNIEILTSAVEADGIHYHIIGGERSGKTALCKYAFLQYYYKNNLTPILLDGEDLSTNTRKDRILQIISKKVKQQYGSIKVLPSSNIDDNNSFVLIIDNFQKTAKGNDKYWGLLTSNIGELFSNVIIVGDISITTNDFAANPPFKNFDKYVIMEFGPDLRNQLVEKWNSFGQDCSIESKNSIRRKNDEANKNINSILGKNFIPAYPFYILGILQALEGIQNSNNINYSLHGFYYEHLINDGFVHSVKNPKDISFYYNFMVFFCYYLFEQKSKALSIDEFDNFYTLYCDKYDVDTSTFGITKVKETLKATKLLLFNNDVRVSQNYIYYFFVAKYISNHIDDDIIKDVVRKLCERIFKEEYANIIMFVTHLSKNSWIIRTLLDNASRIFPNSTICKLEQDIKPLNELMSDLTSRVIGFIDVDKERNKELAREAELEEKQKEFDNDDTNYAQFSLDDDINEIDLFAQMNLAVKSIDILGQIAIKYWGELEATTKYEIVETAYNIGLRTLGLYLAEMSKNKDDLAEYIANVIIEKYSEKNRAQITLKKEEIKTESLTYIAFLSYILSFAIITRISNSVGDDRLGKTFEKILEANPYNSYKLINLSINLNYPGLPMSNIEQYSKDMQDNIMCKRLLQDLVINHLYKFDVDYKNKNKISSLLGIRIQDQLYIQESSQIKRQE